jgi:hypothetical protein
VAHAVTAQGCKCSHGAGMPPRIENLVTSDIIEPLS